jgi:16S rRNA (cytosine1402-N4)-methyltransferase
MTHIPVLGVETIEALQPHKNGIYIDATFGRGGYTALLLEAGAGRVIAIDRDPEAIQAAKAFTTKYGSRFTMIEGCFGDMVQLLHAANINEVDGIAFDIGVSSPQLDTAERGFSFRLDGPLDMRMSGEGQTAADIVNGFAEADLADLIYQYGEERASRRVAKAIVEARRTEKFTRTTQLANVIASVLPKGEIHPATKSFQALRIAVNDELGELQRGLEAAVTLLKEKGRVAVVTFHSLEDRIVKNFFRAQAGRVSQGSRHRPMTHLAQEATLHLVNNKAITASDDEARSNPRARSAKLRVAEKVDHAL